MSDQNEQLAEIEKRTEELEGALLSQSWRFYEVEKQAEEFRRFTIFALAFVYAVSLAVALWVFGLHGW